MKRSHFILVTAIVVSALGTVGACVCFIPSRAYYLEIGEAEVEIADSQESEEREVVYQLNNRSGQPIRVLGLVSSCGENACFHAKYQDLPSSLPPGVTEARFRFGVGHTGVFRTQTTLWVDDHGTREIILTVHGTAKPAPAKTKEKGAAEP